jgi:cation-transporting P-type ATPase A/B/Cu+-exporting ATPase
MAGASLPDTGRQDIITSQPAMPGIPGGMREVTLAVEGMTCAACAARIDRKLARLENVTATVNYATGMARVIAPADLPAAELIDAVTRAGYAAVEAPGYGTADDDRTAGDRAADALVEAAGKAGPALGNAAPPGQEAARFADLRRRLIVAVVFFFPLTDLSLALSLLPSARFPGWQWVLIGCAAPVTLWCAWPFHRAALRGARHGASSMDTLVSLGITAACGWSAYAMFVLDRAGPHGTLWQQLTRGSGGGIYLETAATVTTFLLAGRLYEARARRIASEEIRGLAATAARDATLLEPDGTERKVPVSQLRPGDMLLARPGEAIAADGEVAFGESAIDRAMMTGESVPGEAAEGDHVTAGTVTLTGRLIIRATRVGADTQLSRLLAMVERAQSEKSAIQRTADRICGVFVPAILGCAGLTLAGWLLAGAPAGRAVSAALSVLIIACPCALGLATPAALVAACGRGARLGVFIKGYRALESSRSASVVVLDKTGTVTTGRMMVTGVWPAEGASRAELLRYAGAVEQASEHAVAAAIAATAAKEAARNGTGPLPRADGFMALPGLGARGSVEGREVLVGRRHLLASHGMDVPDELSAQCARWERAGFTAVLAGWDGAARGAVAVADAIKPSARAAIAELRGLGLHPVLLTGDNEATARAVAAVVGIGEVIAGTLPAGKAEVIAGLQARGRPGAGGGVAMVGDGVNDGPALAAADLGLALGSGTDVAICAADMILLRDDLHAVPDAIRLARATHRTIRGNLAWAFGYNAAMVPLAALGLLNPLIASAAMTLSSAFVMWNSLRLQRYPIQATPGRRPRRTRTAARGVPA